MDEAALERFALDIQSSLSKLVQKRGERAYPRRARVHQWEGTTQIAVEFGANGQLKSITVPETSGHAVLDKKAIEMVREVLPEVPSQLLARNFTVRLPIEFKLRRSTAFAGSTAFYIAFGPFSLSEASWYQERLSASGYPARDGPRVGLGKRKVWVGPYETGNGAQAVVEALRSQQLLKSPFAIYETGW